MELEEMVTQYSTMLFRICLLQLGNEQDAQDAVQETFLRYLRKGSPCLGEAAKAWLIKVAINICKNMKRFHMRHPSIAIEELSDYYEAPQQGQALKELMNLPVKYHSVLYLYYVEGYKTREIAKILGITENNVRKRMQRGKVMFRMVMEEENA